MSEEKKHALLSASSAHKWLECTPSARLETKFENKTSEYMEEGTLAHEIAEFKVRSYFLEPTTKRKTTAQLKKFEKRKYYSPEMLKHAEDYLDYIKQLTLDTSAQPFITVEKEVRFDDYVPEGFGTADCIVVKGNTLHVIDFKYGKGVMVSAEENPQMKLYALGALKAYGIIYPITNVKMTIFQPRLESVSEATIGVINLLGWAENVVKPQAQKAFAGIGDYNQGHHCRFCRARGACEFRAKENMKVIESIQTSGLLDSQEIADVITKTEGFEDWIKSVREYALEQILKGEEIPGYKVVEGKSNRKLVDVEKAFEILEESGIDKALLYERKPLTLTGLERTIGKKEVADYIGDYIEKPKGAPTLVKSTDKRTEYQRISAIEEFKSIESEAE